MASETNFSPVSGPSMCSKSHVWSMLTPFVALIQYSRVSIPRRWTTCLEQLQYSIIQFTSLLTWMNNWWAPQILYSTTSKWAYIMPCRRLLHELLSCSVSCVPAYTVLYCRSIDDCCMCANCASTSPVTHHPYSAIPLLHWNRAYSALHNVRMSINIPFFEMRTFCPCSLWNYLLSAWQF